MLQLLIATVLAWSVSDVQLAQDPVIVPMTHATKHATVWVHVNGKGPFLFQVDTYSSLDGSIDDDLARELALVKSGSVMSSDGQTSVSKDQVAVDELRLGGATFSDLTLTVNDYAWIDRPDGEQVHGILGFGSFRDVLLTFDYPDNRLVLSRDELKADDEHTIPFSVEASGSPDIRLTLAGRELVFGIDTGATGYLCFNRALAQDLPFHSAPRKIGQVQTHHNTFDVYETVLDGTLDFAGHPRESVGFRLIDGWGRGMVGYRLLRSYAVSFDQRAGLVRFTRPPAPTAVVLSGDQLDRWVGDYASGSKRFAIERDGDALFFRIDQRPRVATIALAKDELQLASEPTHLFLRSGWFGNKRLEIQTHPDAPAIEARRR